MMMLISAVSTEKENVTLKMEGLKSEECFIYFQVIRNSL